jgi:hypothetical protein
MATATTAIITITTPYDRHIGASQPVLILGLTQEQWFSQEVVPWLSYAQATVYKMAEGLFEKSVDHAIYLIVPNTEIKMFNSFGCEKICSAYQSVCA